MLFILFTQRHVISVSTLHSRALCTSHRCTHTHKRTRTHKWAHSHSYLYTALQKFGNALEKWGFGLYWHESFLICDNFALIRDNTNYENIFYYINNLYIEKTYIFDSSKYPPLAAITALHNLGIRAVSLFKHWLWIGNQLLKLQY